MTITKIEHMINPEVLASMVDGELEFALKFTNLATVDHTLVGRPGNTVSLPAYKMIGEAVDVAEGEAIPVEALATENENVTVIHSTPSDNAINNKIISHAIKLGRPKIEKLMAKGLLERPTRILVAGMPNVGKSSIINRLIKKK